MESMGIYGEVMAGVVLGGLSKTRRVEHRSLVTRWRFVVDDRFQENPKVSAEVGARLYDRLGEADVIEP